MLSTKTFSKILLFLTLFSVTGCERFGFNPFNYNTGEGAKLKVINKNKKDSGYYFTTRGPKVVLKKKLQMGWDERYYNAIIDELSVNPKPKNFIFY